MEMQYILRNRVRELRMRLNLNQVQVAADTGVTRQTILAIEKDRLTPSVMLALRIARVLREPVDYVFYLDRVPVQEASSHALAPVEQPDVVEEAMATTVEAEPVHPVPIDPLPAVVTPAPLPVQAELLQPEPAPVAESERTKEEPVAFFDFA